MKLICKKIANIEGAIVKIGQTIELPAKVAKKYIDHGFVREVKDLKELHEFESKEQLDEYGKEFGINLNRSKTLENMYADLVEHVEV
jgi:hypothetical protein